MKNKYVFLKLFAIAFIYLNFFKFDKNIIVANQISYFDTSVTDKFANLNLDNPEMLSVFETSFKDGKQSRIDNITLASVAIDETVLYPGEIFSFNKTVGPTTKSRGYKKSKVFFKGKETEGYGGGVCQVSSTIYNAALNAGLEIVERHPHSKKVYYVPEGKDAATSHGGIDLKIKNNKEFPIRINSYIMDYKIYVLIEKL